MPSIIRKRKKRKRQATIGQSRTTKTTRTTRDNAREVAKYSPLLNTAKVRILQSLKSEKHLATRQRLKAKGGMGDGRYWVNSLWELQAKGLIQIFQLEPEQGRPKHEYKITRKGKHLLAKAEAWANS